MRRVFCTGLILSVISLLSLVICPDTPIASPTLESLGQINEGLSVPTRLDVDTAGNLYIADPRQKTIFVFDRYGRATAEFPVDTLSGGGLAVTADGQRLYAACGQSVLILDGKTGQRIGELGTGGETFGAVGFIDIGAHGQVYVADTQQRLVLVFDAEGTHRVTFGAPDTSSGQFASIFALAIDPASNEIYVGDSVRTLSSQSKVYVFSAQGELLRTLLTDNEAAFGAPPLFFFGGITFDQQGNAYFLDTYRSNVRVVQLPDSYQTSVAMPSLLPGNMERPVDAAFDPVTKRLFVACDGGRVEIFGLNGAGNPDPNSPPGLPALFHPIAGSEVDTSTPQLSFRNAEDPDNDVLKYDVRLIRDEQQVALYENLPQYLPTSFVQIDEALVENAAYTWSVRAKDAVLTSDWTTTETFYVNAVQETPDTPEITLPAEMPTLGGSGRLEWSSSNDPDPFDTVRYHVDIFLATNLSEPVASEEMTDTSITLNAFDAYDQLVSGETYSWQVTAIDNHDLASAASVTGQFVYNTTTLRIEADQPEAQAFLSGNHAYSGRFLGQVPVVLRDVPTGTFSVVVEAPGFEPFIEQVAVEQGDQTSVDARLIPAVTPDWKPEGKQLLDTKLTATAPFLVDFDNNGTIDLLIGDAGGAITLYPGDSSRKSLSKFEEERVLDLPLVPGAVPFVADWDNDDRKDLLVGSTNGTITLFRNIGSETDPVFDDGSLVEAANTPIALSGRVAPVLIDLDGDHDKDLLVGTGNGQLLLYENILDDQQPSFAEARELARVEGPAAPFATNWNADGLKDLIVACDTGLKLFLQENGIFSNSSLLQPAGSSIKNKDRTETATFSLGEGPVLFVYDVDNKRGKDLVVGNQDGKLMLFRSTTKPTRVKTPR